MPKNLYLPANFDVKSYLPENLTRYTPEANYLLHLIECRRVFFKERREAFVPLKKKYLENIMGSRHSKEIVDTLRQHELIERDTQYIVGEKCFGYRLGSKLREAEFKPSPCPTRIHKRLVKQETTLTLPIHLHLRSCLQRVTIDYESAKSLLLASNAYKEDFVSLDMIHHKDFWFVPDAYGRVHTNITSLKSDLRQFLRFGKQAIHFVDVVNSQPFFLSVVVANYSDNDSCIKSFNSFSGSSICSRSSVFPPKEEREEKAYHYDLPFLDNKQLQRLNRLDYSNDKKQFIKLTEQGQLYEQLQQLWNLDRQTAKKRFFSHVLFCKKFDNEYRDKFQKQFPEVLEVIDDLKTRDYRHCGQMLQRAESAIVIHKACEQLRKDCPQMPLLTIHDSIGTTEQYLPLLKEAFQNAFKGLGMQPSFKCEFQLN